MIVVGGIQYTYLRVHHSDTFMVAVKQKSEELQENSCSEGCASIWEMGLLGVVAAPAMRKSDGFDSHIFHHRSFV